MATFARTTCGFEVSDDEGNTTWIDKDNNEIKDDHEDDQSNDKQEDNK